MIMKGSAETIQPHKELRGFLSLINLLKSYCYHTLSEDQGYYISTYYSLLNTEFQIF